MWCRPIARTRISEGLYPEVATVEAQARTAIPWYNNDELKAILDVLATAYSQTMAGTASATEAAATAQTLLVSDLWLSQHGGHAPLHGKRRGHDPDTRCG